MFDTDLIDIESGEMTLLDGDVGRCEGCGEGLELNPGFARFFCTSCAHKPRRSPPNPDVIAARAAYVRRSWTPEDYEKRLRPDWRLVPWLAPVIDDSDVELIGAGFD